jgi:hypothetical protein
LGFRVQQVSGVGFQLWPFGLTGGQEAWVRSGVRAPQNSRSEWGFRDVQGFGLLLLRRVWAVICEFGPDCCRAYAPCWHRASPRAASGCKRFFIGFGGLSGSKLQVFGRGSNGWFGFWTSRRTPDLTASKSNLVKSPADDSTSLKQRAHACIERTLWLIRQSFTCV